MLYLQHFFHQRYLQQHPFFPSVASLRKSGTLIQEALQRKTLKNENKSQVKKNQFLKRLHRIKSSHYRQKSCY